MAKKLKDKAKDDQLQRFKERAAEYEAVSEEEFERTARKVATSKPPKESKD
jgi:hypothetical protein